MSASRCAVFVGSDYLKPKEITYITLYLHSFYISSFLPANIFVFIGEGVFSGFFDISQMLVINKLRSHERCLSWWLN